MSAATVATRRPFALPARPGTGVATAATAAATPVLRLDTAAVADAYARLVGALPGVRLHYAVKANPAHEVLTTLAALGCRWDVASPGEVDAVLRAGGDPADLSYGNTVKRAADIAYAYAVGVRRFTFDAPDELAKLSEHAPGSTVLVRIATSGAGADWVLGGKFGCSPAEAAVLLARAVRAGHPVGVAFHVGSQQRDPGAWDQPLATTSVLRSAVRQLGADLRVVDLGGGLPADLLGATPRTAEYGRAIAASLARHLGPQAADRPEVMAEPGRALVADAGTLDTEVVLVSVRAGTRWVYLDAGVFTGLVETVGEAIRYRITVLRDGRPLEGAAGPVVLAGPTCDSLDVLYAEHRYALPLDLRPGDVVRLHSTGAYTASYSTVGFNGFAPLRQEFR